MNTLKKTVAAAVVPLLVSSPALATEWEIDPSHTAAQFSVKHMMISTVRGEFGKVAGTVNLDEQDVSKSTVNVTIDASTLNTRDEKRDGHLKSPDFFDVAKYPSLAFKSTRVEKAGKNKFKVTGDLTMKDQTHPVTLFVEGPEKAQKSPWGQTVRGFTATGRINRKDWGLSWNKGLETGGVLVGEEVQLQIDAELIQKSGTTAAK